MPKCPECGYTDSTISSWIRDTAETGDSSGDILVVCPSCDVVLGGGGWAAGH